MERQEVACLLKMIGEAQVVDHSQSPAKYAHRQQTRYFEIGGVAGDLGALSFLGEAGSDEHHRVSAECHERQAVRLVGHLGLGELERVGAERQEFRERQVAGHVERAMKPAESRKHIDGHFAKPGARRHGFLLYLMHVRDPALGSQ
jgi:hypothetical protein